MSDLGPGDWVECLKNTKGLFVVGGLYRCTELRPDPTGCEDPDCHAFGMRVAEAPCPWPGGWWCSCGFRPIYRPKGKQLLRDLMEPVKEPVGG